MQLGVGQQRLLSKVSSLDKTQTNARTIDSRILKFDKLTITNIIASRFNASLQGPFYGKKTMIVSRHDKSLTMSFKAR